MNIVQKIYYNILNSKRHFKFLIYTINNKIFHCIYRNANWYMVDEDLDHDNINQYPILSYELLENINTITSVDRYVETDNYMDGEHIVRIIDVNTRYPIYTN